MTTKSKRRNRRGEETTQQAASFLLRMLHRCCVGNGIWKERRKNSAEGEHACVNEQIRQQECKHGAFATCKAEREEEEEEEEEIIAAHVSINCRT